MLTGTHVVHATSAELCAHFIGGSQTKVSDSQTKTVVKTEDVLRLQVAVIDIERMAIVNCIKQLEENFPDQVVLTEISAVMEDLRKEITIATVVHDDPSVLRVLDDAMQGHNTRVCRGQLMKSNLADVQLPLAS